jgi:hypothetical protein
MEWYIKNRWWVWSENNFNHCFPINLNVLLKMLNIVYEIDLVKCFLISNSR